MEQLEGASDVHYNRQQHSGGKRAFAMLTEPIATSTSAVIVSRI
jgi:hypothetical protein